MKFPQYMIIEAREWQAFFSVLHCRNKGSDLWRSLDKGCQCPHNTFYVPAQNVECSQLCVRPESFRTPSKLPSCERQAAEYAKVGFYCPLLDRWQSSAFWESFEINYVHMELGGSIALCTFVYPMLGPQYVDLPNPCGILEQPSSQFRLLSRKLSFK